MEILTSIMQIALGSFFFIYFIFVGTTIMMAVTGKIDKGTTQFGQVIWYHGMVWIAMLCMTTVGGLTYLFIQVVNKFLNG